MVPQKAEVIVLYRKPRYLCVNKEQCSERVAVDALRARPKSRSFKEQEESSVKRSMETLEYTTSVGLKDGKMKPKGGRLHLIFSPCESFG